MDSICSSCKFGHCMTLKCTHDKEEEWQGSEEVLHNIIFCYYPTSINPKAEPLELLEVTDCNRYKDEGL